MDAMKHIAAGAVLLGAIFAANAHPQVTDPVAPAPPLRYESVFSDYRPQKDIPLLPWKNLFTEDGDFADMTDAASTEAKLPAHGAELPGEEGRSFSTRPSAPPAGQGLRDAPPVTVRKPQNGHRGHGSHSSGRKVTLDAQTDTPITK